MTVTSIKGVIISLACLAFIAGMVTCMGSLPVQSVDGGGTETVIGTLCEKNGEAAARTFVQMLPFDYDPVAALKTGKNPLMIDTTDNAGRYIFRKVNKGRYTIQSVHLDKRTRSMQAGVVVDADTVEVNTDTLDYAGTVKVMRPQNADIALGYMFIRGTNITAPIDGTKEYVMLDSVPAGIAPTVCYGVRTGAAAPVAIREGLQVVLNDTVTVAFPGWVFAVDIHLNTTSSGAGTKSMVRHFPTLIRINGGNFNFARAARDGRDVRFAKSDNTPLTFEIERWDSANGMAELWVAVDTIYANDNSRYITMYWGNPDAAGKANAAGVFDTTYGYQGVWHLAETPGMYTRDATPNHYDGIPYGMSEGSFVEGVIGKAQKFDGMTSYIAFPYTYNGKLNFPEQSSYFLSAWVYPETIDSTYGAILSKGIYQYFLQLGYGNNWGFIEYKDALGWEKTSSPATGLSEKTWNHLVGVRSGTKQYLYVNGVCTDSSSALIGATAGRNTQSDFMIGKMVNLSQNTLFRGIIDEVRAANIAPAADWIRLCYLNQKPENAFVYFSNSSK